MIGAFHCLFCKHILLPPIRNPGTYYQYRMDPANNAKCVKAHSDGPGGNWSPESRVSWHPSQRDVSKSGYPFDWLVSTTDTHPGVWGLTPTQALIVRLGTFSIDGRVHVYWSMDLKLVAPCGEYKDVLAKTGARCHCMGFFHYPRDIWCSLATWPHRRPFGLLVGAHYSHLGVWG